MLNLNIKDINWKRELNTWVKVVMDVKVASLLLFLAFIIYGIGYDTAYTPQMKSLKLRDEAIQEEKKRLQEKQGLKQQYRVWNEQLKDLETQMIPIKPGESITVLSVTESSELLKLARGEKREESLLPKLPPPHDERTNLELKQLEQKEITISQGPEAPGNPENGEAPSEADNAPPLTVQRYNYQIKMRGTYPALLDFMNELISQPYLYQVHKVSFTKVTGEAEPNPDEFPEYPVPVEMIMEFFVYFYDSAS